MSADAERAWGALLRVHARLVPVLDAAVQAAASLPVTWYDVLLELHSAGGRLTMSDLADRVTLSRTRVSRIVDDLTRDGFVAREANPEDGRSSFAVITAAGRNRFRAAAPRYVAAIDRALAGPLSGAELRALAAALEKVLGATRLPLEQ